MAFRLALLAVCLGAAVAFPCQPPPCHPPPPCVKYVEVPVPILEQVNVPVPSPVPVPVLAPTITETWTRLAGTTSGNGAEQKVLTTSAPAPPVALPLPNAPAASPCGGPLAGAELIFNANAPALALGASPLALNGGLAYNGILGAGYGAPFGAEIVAPAYGNNFAYGPAYGHGAGINYGPAPYLNEFAFAPAAAAFAPAAAPFAGAYGAHGCY